MLKICLVQCSSNHSLSFLKGNTLHDCLNIISTQLTMWCHKWCHMSQMSQMSQMWHHVWFFWLQWLIGLMLHNVWHHMVTCDHIICKPSWSVLFLLLRMNLTIKSLGKNRALMGFIFQHSSLCLQLNKICQNFWLDSLIDGSQQNYYWNVVPSIL